MAIERTFHCDGPDCERHARTASHRAPTGFIVVTDGSAALHFCTWDCVLRYAAAKPPAEMVLLD